ncbi:MAG: hypothetical protein COX39_00970 [Candidatus Nealsonbacteria bacterium CG23_combo_of_CG06-09_8_20_14_all_40_13]|uniref:Peptidase M10 metallopeptidase domain-containing protein n=1 Tax=Candidatus Nealsonbacteria bacterium CG23_combo_of_CG06-09_8_20_14_all_40_13 TaxID=1974724 RepID=A0A2G9YTG7_9BACT|nr:MAG: hypothetical protein COX39_00970 [Candidatus Nealsonbacteria bacterium CG23_combo_of_CG06-09_8_20_14_all_40_13]PIR70851.1 MAG: hypothetical protein COU44_02805 [Candidatus Nealsonbacteria bacterium CG10_big_fil_rev_8_21_14_0_10_40_24]PIU43416.1 MAG: hypothetical protein COS97_01165 [Candidatus Nealsonbacteria bacterium CG07_land_8_20_14_0_80_40_10]
MKKLLAFLLGLAVAFYLISFLFTGPVSAAKDEVKLRVFVHYPNPHGKPVADPCTATTNDQVQDFGLAGWQMPDVGVTYKINYRTKPKNLSNSQVNNAISSSFATWHSADSKQIFNDGGPTSVKAAKYDGINAILFKGASSSAIAITYVWYYVSSGQLAEVDTVFNKIYKWSYTAYNGTNDCGGVANTFDIQNIGTHEFGHWVGLDDLYSSVDKDLTMYGYGDTSELKKDSLGAGDILGVNTITP